MSQDQALDKIFEAAIFAARKHQGQVRKDNRRSPYITHPLQVAQILWDLGGVRNPQTLIAAILHDTIEDTGTTRMEIRETFGEEVLLIILEVTDDKSLEKMTRKRMQVVHAPELSEPARLIKLGDKLVNCRDILQNPPSDWPLERRRNYIQWGADVIEKIRGTNQALENAFDQMLTEAQEQLDFIIQPFKTVDERPWGPSASQE
ncbi:MAG: HD domain-containing protein [Brevefilum sp.]